MKKTILSLMVMACVSHHGMGMEQISDREATSLSFNIIVGPEAAGIKIKMTAATKLLMPCAEFRTEISDALTLLGAFTVHMPQPKEYGLLNYFKREIENGSAINTQHYINENNEEIRLSPLTALCSLPLAEDISKEAVKEYRETLELLIAKGCDVNENDGTHLTPLGAATVARNKEAIWVLRSKGALKFLGALAAKEKTGIPQGKLPVDIWNDAGGESVPGVLGYINQGNFSLKKGAPVTSKEEALKYEQEELVKNKGLEIPDEFSDRMDRN